MLAFEQVRKVYDGSGGRTEVLRGLDFRLSPGETAVIRGPSGCGKSTLLFTAGAMLPPDSGRVRLGDESLYEISGTRRNRLRASSVGFVFQRFHLVPYLTVAENILWPLRWQSDTGEPGQRFADLVRKLRLESRLNERPGHLSAGEQQRVALARALIGGKRLICADEPTGNLDEENAAIVLDMLKEEAGRGAMVLLVTHHATPPGYGDIECVWPDSDSPRVIRENA